MDASTAAFRPPALSWRGATLADVQVRVFDDPIDAPVRNAFGTMHTRPGLLVRLRDEDGHCGHGEVWCNFPQGGARYKATLIEKYARPALRGLHIDRPEQVSLRLHALFGMLLQQCADHGAIAQLISGLDQAAWDLFCHRAGQPFWRLMGGRQQVPVYASGIGPRRVDETMRAEHAAGHIRFKVKLGFGEAADTQILDTALATLQALPGAAALMVDVNQGWSPEQAQAWLPRLAAAGVVWCEEPLRADTPWSTWQALAAHAPGIRLAAGENLLGMPRFLEAVAQGAIRVLQPDLGKWGGISGNLELAQRLPRNGVWLCPHWLAGGVGLMASLQFKAAIGGDGWVEMDANPNRLRSEALAQPLAVRDGMVVLPDTPGLVPALAGWLDDPQAWRWAEDEVAHAG